MEKGVKVVAVNDPFIDPEYMVSSRWREGPAGVVPELGGGFQELYGKPCRIFPKVGTSLGLLALPPKMRTLSTAGIHVQI